MSLDKRLEELLKDYLRDNLDNWGHKGEDVESYLRGQQPNYTKSVIKQAFIDEGWYHSPLVTHQMSRIESGELMTGPEWLARFEKYRPTPRQQAAIDFNKEVSEAACLAAGVNV